MIDFMNKITNDDDFKNRFIEFAHTKEKDLDFLNSDISESLYEFIYRSIHKYAEENSYDIQDDEEIIDQTKKFCKTVSDEINTYVIQQFSDDLHNYLDLEKR